LYNPHIIFKVSGVACDAAFHRQTREDIQRFAARNLGEEYALLDVKDERGGGACGPRLG